MLLMGVLAPVVQLLDDLKVLEDIFLDRGPGESQDAVPLNPHVVWNHNTLIVLCIAVECMMDCALCYTLFYALYVLHAVVYSVHCTSSTVLY